MHLCVLLLLYPAYSFDVDLKHFIVKVPQKVPECKTVSGIVNREVLNGLLQRYVLAFNIENKKNSFIYLST